MEETKQQKIVDCIKAFNEGKLTEENLRQTLEDASSWKPKHQDLLYLQTNSTSVGSRVHGMSIVQDGEISDGPPDPDDWPYETPLEAMRDGWRVIQFPNMALIMDESKAYGLGCEFILERWR
tara:strand:- start:72 stop:437 length:366 start_codon:yes stop_codon:yes gene_type:complete